MGLWAMALHGASQTGGEAQLTQVRSGAAHSVAILHPTFLPTSHFWPEKEPKHMRGFASALAVLVAVHTLFHGVWAEQLEMINVPLADIGMYQAIDYDMGFGAALSISPTGTWLVRSARGASYRCVLPYRLTRMHAA